MRLESDPAAWQVCEAFGHVGPDRDSTVHWRDLGLMCDACEAAYGDIRLTVRTLERIRNHAHSGDDPALLAQQELDRIRREGRA
jgi:hypothetical protein